MRIAQIPRREWLSCYFDYQPGQHAAWFQATQQGKTYNMWECAQVALTQNPGLRGVSLMPKSRDPATRIWAERLGWKILDDWPPPPRWPGTKPPPGYVLWPKHLSGVPVEVNRKHLAGIIRKCLMDQFQRGESMTIADDAYNLGVLLDLNADLEEILTAGAGGGAGLWLSGQKPSGTRQGGSLTTFAYNQPEHIMLGYEPMPENRKRFSDIGAVDAGAIGELVAHLPRHPIKTPYGIKNVSEQIHIDKRGPYLCQVTGL